jgi:DNA-binding transcriptional ArsR family regulator
MAPDLLSTICGEIDERLSELRPLLAERDQLLEAADALIAEAGEAVSDSAAAKAKPVKRGGGRAQARPRGRGSAAGALERAAAPTIADEVAEPATPSEAADGKASRRRPKPAPKPKPGRAARGAAREAILAALDHGSHTVSELAVVTAMSGPNLNGNLRRLHAEGAVVKTEREGKAAWALAGSGPDVG